MFPRRKRAVSYGLAEKLGVREKKIISFLKKHGDGCSLASVRKYTEIPNTTLHRLIRKLERNNILTTIKIKKIRIVILAN